MHDDPIDRKFSIQTLTAQALGDIDETTRAIVPAIHPSTTYLRDPDGAYRSGRGYTRADNPTYDVVEGMLTALENGEAALLFASGMAACSAVFQALLPGDHVLAPRVMYWALRKWLLDFAVPWGLDVEFIDMADPQSVRQRMRPGQTRLIWLETPANPLWDIVDIGEVCEAAHSVGARVAVDSTVATPVLTRPIDHGADFVVHSATKYLNGHSDVLAGAIVTRRRDGFWYRIRAVQRDGGAVLGPFEAWLLGRGMRTLFPRVQVASASALTIAQRFQSDPRVREVLYPGLATHPGHETAARQMQGGFSGMLSIRLADGEAAAVAAAARVQLFKRATSLGGIESLIEHRASIEGPSTPVPADLLRLSVGLESVDDLIWDLDQAFDYDRGSIVIAPIETSPSQVPGPDIEAQIRHVLETSVRPAVIARGGDFEIQSIDKGGDGESGDKVVVKALGSPGAMLSLRDWGTGLLVNHIGRFIELQVDDGDDRSPSPSDDLLERLALYIEESINPSLATHEGALELIAIRDGVVEIRFLGRCLGCAMSEVTLRQGAETMMKDAFPEVLALSDVSDHDTGRNPYYSPGKSGQTPKQARRARS